MLSEEKIKKKIEDIDKAIKDLAGSGNTEEIGKLVRKAETLEWVLEIKK